MPGEAVVITGSDLSNCVIKSVSTKVPADVFPSPDDNWKPRLANLDRGLIAQPQDGGPDLLVTQTFGDFIVSAKLNLIDAAVASIRQLAMAVESIPQDGLAAGITGIKSSLQTLLSDVKRDLIVHWTWTFTVEGEETTHHVAIKHVLTYTTNLAKSTTKTPGRMSWIIDAKVNLRGPRPNLYISETGTESKKVSAEMSERTDTVLLPSGQHTITSIYQLHLEGTGFRNELQSVFDALVSALDGMLQQLANLSNAVEDYIRDWINNNTYVPVLGGPSTAEIDAERAAERQRKQDAIRNGVKSAVQRFVQVLVSLLDEWSGYIQYNSSQYLLQCVTEEKYRELVTGEKPSETDEEISPTLPTPPLSGEIQPPNTDAKPEKPSKIEKALRLKKNNS